MDAMLRASIYLKGILPLMENLVTYDQQAAAAIKGQNLVFQFEVRKGPAAFLEIHDGKIKHTTGLHPSPDIHLTFRTPDTLNRLFAGEKVTPGIRKGFTHLGFLTRKFPILSERLNYYLEGEGQKADSPQTMRFLVDLGLHAMLAGTAAVANDDPELSDIAAATPVGSLLVKVLPDEPYGAITRTPGPAGFTATFGQPVEHANAVMEFANLAVARQLLTGQLSAVVGIGTGQIHVRGSLPLVEKINIFLGRFSKLMGLENTAPEEETPTPAAVIPPGRYPRSVELFLRATKVIPEGIYGHKNPAFMLPGASPYYAARGDGCRVWDVDGNEYLDFLCSYGPVILGHNHPEVERAVRAQMSQGVCFNHPGEAMVQLAERLVGLLPGMGWAVFAKNGSDVTTWATRVAREHTGRPKIIMVGGAYHGVHAWCTAYPGGVLPDEKGNVLKMGWNRLDELESLLARHGGEVAGVILTPYHHPTYAAQVMPAEGFWASVREICNRVGMLLILDDIRAGFRLSTHGSLPIFGIQPDLICHSKAMANGHPIAAALGTPALLPAAESVFLSGTFWFTPAPMVAALATLKVLEETDAIAQMARLGARLGEGLKELAAKHGYRVTISGPPALPYMTFDDDPDLFHMQEFCRQMIARGVFLHPHHNWFLCAAHTDANIDFALEMADLAFAHTRQLLD